MTTVYVIRHPQTTWNVASRYQGRLEPPLSPEGEVQSRMLARVLAGQDLAAVVSSPLCRALMTAREIATATDAPLLVDQRLTEIGLGEWEGMVVSDIEARYPEELTGWRERPDVTQIPGGELLEQVAQRARDALNAVFHSFPRGDVVIVTHSAIVRSLAALSLGLDLRYIHRLPASNGGITTFCGTETRWRLVWLNDVTALYQSPLAAAEAVGCADNGGAA